MPRNLHTANNNNTNVTLAFTQQSPGRVFGTCAKTNKRHALGNLRASLCQGYRVGQLANGSQQRVARRFKGRCDVRGDVTEVL